MTNQKPIQFIKLLHEICLNLKIPLNNWLDIGCGNGKLVYLLNQKGFSTLGIDVEFKEGEYISELLSNNKVKQIKSPDNCRSSVINNDSFYKWPIEDNSINFAFSSSVLEHVINPLKFIEENNRILKVGGFTLHYLPSKFALIEPHVGVPLGGFFQNKKYYKFICSLGFCFKRYKNNGDEAFKYVHQATNYFNKKELINLFVRNGFYYIGEFSSYIPKYLGPNLSKWISNIPFLIYLFSIFRSHIICFKKV